MNRAASHENVARRRYPQEFTGIGERRPAVVSHGPKLGAVGTHFDSDDIRARRYLDIGVAVEIHVQGIKVRDAVGMGDSRGPKLLAAGSVFDEYRIVGPAAI